MNLAGLLAHPTIRNTRISRASYHHVSAYGHDSTQQSGAHACTRVRTSYVTPRTELAKHCQSACSSLALEIGLLCWEPVSCSCSP